MEVAKSPLAARKVIRGLVDGKGELGVVPTMGDLHEGHLSLVRMSLQRCGRTAVSIFVNPRQFGPGEDLDRYPRNEKRDLELLGEMGVDLVFMPKPRDIYSSRDRTRVTVNSVTDYLCGAHRPGHFDGVALIVAKLFNILSPDIAFFGQKDAQQAVVIQRMAADLDFPVKIKLGPIVREENGLAMSSRNRYLNQEQRERAGSIYGGLRKAKRAVDGGERDSARVSAIITGAVEKAGMSVEYAEVVDAQRMTPVKRVEGRVLLAVAAYMDEVRLIDNIALNVGGDRAEEMLLEFPEWSRYE
ncbi:MAG: pantoate--beta-alanine ligase [Candidatus Latescibacteria bacterium]|nr:pantoate--beta-alanine ligase [bacterium]MBD3423321.1 pantoate--beta-alanine ligase [Candidatus Latescibacterota bacterium]